MIFELPTYHVRDLCERASRRQQETDQDLILIVDLDTETCTYEYVAWVMESIRSKLKPDMRTTASI